nr:MAG TPA: hypothetical protein [Bacteriophage sp.]
MGGFLTTCFISSYNFSPLFIIVIIGFSKSILG